MEEWEILYKHEKDKRDSQCISQGIEIPKDEKYGTLKPIKGLWMSFRGKEFWQEFGARGHTHKAFEECDCRFKGKE